MLRRAYQRMRSRIDPEEELKNFAPIDLDQEREGDVDLISTAAFIAKEFNSLKKGDIKIASGVQEIPQKVREELTSLIAEYFRAEKAALSCETQCYLETIMDIYDLLDDQLMVAAANREEQKRALIAGQLANVKSILRRIDLIPFDALGEIYNPREHDGYVVANPEAYKDQNPRTHEIVHVLRKGFRNKEGVIRKPVVQFYE